MLPQAVIALRKPYSSIGQVQSPNSGVQGLNVGVIDELSLCRANVGCMYFLTPWLESTIVIL